MIKGFDKDEALEITKLLDETGSKIPFKDRDRLHIWDNSEWTEIMKEDLQEGDVVALYDTKEEPRTDYATVRTPSGNVLISLSDVK